MPKALLITGEIVEIPAEQMVRFLSENRDKIQARRSPRRRAPL